QTAAAEPEQKTRSKLAKSDELLLCLIFPGQPCTRGEGNASDRLIYFWASPQYQGGQTDRRQISSFVQQVPRTFGGLPGQRRTAS
ncbi:MAG: hypothetical protein ACLPTZ_25980, partial [Beijerinckiaceae bacterium]